MGVKLIDLTQAELEARRPAMAAWYAHDVALSFGVDPQVALEQTVQELSTSLADGVDTEGQLFWKAVDDGDEIGLLWISMPGIVFPDMAWISEIEVDEGRRGRGYGRQMIAAGEADLLARDVHRIGLHVFGHNTDARRLYLRLGYRILSQVRARPIDPELQLDGELTLVPMTQDGYEDRLHALAAEDPFALVRDPGATTADALRAAARNAPDGVTTEGTLLLAAEVDGDEVGWLWLALPNPGRPTTGLIAYLGVDPEHRRRGHGRRMIAAAEAELARYGVPRIGLTVPGRAEALAFADTLDMTLISEQMVKDL